MLFDNSVDSASMQKVQVQISDACLRLRLLQQLQESMQQLLALLPGLQQP